VPVRNVPGFSDGPIRKCPVLNGSRKNQGVSGITWRICGRHNPCRAYSRDRDARPDYANFLYLRIQQSLMPDKGGAVAGANSDN